MILIPISSKDFEETCLAECLSHISKCNLDVRIAFKRKLHGGFDIEAHDPWKYKYVRDKGRYPKFLEPSVPTNGNFKRIDTQLYET